MKTTLHVRMERDLKTKFKELCYGDGKTMSSVLQEYIKKLLEQHEKSTDNITE